MSQKRQIVHAATSLKSLWQTWESQCRLSFAKMDTNFIVLIFQTLLSKTKMYWLCTNPDEGDSTHGAIYHL